MINVHALTGSGCCGRNKQHHIIANGQMGIGRRSSAWKLFKKKNRKTHETAQFVWNINDFVWSNCVSSSERNFWIRFDGTCIDQLKMYESIHLSSFHSSISISLISFSLALFQVSSWSHLNRASNFVQSFSPQIIDSIKQIQHKTVAANHLHFTQHKRN